MKDDRETAPQQRYFYNLLTASTLKALLHPALMIIKAPLFERNAADGSSPVPP